MGNCCCCCVCFDAAALLAAGAGLFALLFDGFRGTLFMGNGFKALMLPSFSTAQSAGLLLAMTLLPIPSGSLFSWSTVQHG